MDKCLHLICIGLIAGGHGKVELAVLAQRRIVPVKNTVLNALKFSLLTFCIKYLAVLQDV